MVEYYIEWAPNPDPLYHDPGESPQEMTIDPPLLDTPIPVSGYMVSLEHLIGGRAKKSFRRAAKQEGINKVLNYSGPVVIDSGGFQGTDDSPEKVLELQNTFSPDVVIQKDTVGDSDQTILDAERTYESADKYDFEVWYVIQGSSVEEYLQCATRLKEIGCERYCLGNLAGRSFLGKTEEVSEIVETVADIVDGDRLHLLGVSNPGILQQISNNIDSFDSSSAIRNATMLREVYEWRNNGIEYHKKCDSPPEEFRCTCPVCDEFDVFTNEFNLEKYTGARRRVRQMRAIHNGWVIGQLADRVS